MSGFPWREFTDLITISSDDAGSDRRELGHLLWASRLPGSLGQTVATLGCILPSCVIVTLLAKLYLKYRNMGMLQGILGSLRPAVVAHDRLRRNLPF